MRLWYEALNVRPVVQVMIMERAQKFKPKRVRRSKYHSVLPNKPDAPLRHALKRHPIMLYVLVPMAVVVNLERKEGTPPDNNEKPKRWVS